MMDRTKELGISCISSELDRLEASYGFSFR
jgi:hypothetical protein